MDTEILNESLVIFGCGYVGLALAKECVGFGWSVTALTRNPESARKAEEVGAHTVLGNLQDDHWWAKIPKGVDHVVNCVGASSPTVEGYQKSYLQGMQSIIQMNKQRWDTVRTHVFTSSSSVYPQTDGSIVDEESDTTGASARGQILLSAELCLEDSGPFAACKGVIRFSGLYGPGRHLLVDKIERGEPMTGSPDRILNLLHRDDAVSSILAFSESLCFTGGIFNASDGQHATRGEIARWVAQRLKVPEPVFTGVGDTRGGHRRVDPPKFRRFWDGNQSFLIFSRATKIFLPVRSAKPFIRTMPGVGKLLKQAQKMQKLMEEAQAKLSEEVFEVSGGGGAVTIKISGQGEFQDLQLDAEFSRKIRVCFEAILQTVKDAAEQAKKKSDDAMGSLTSGVQMPGFF